jgi:hypothetical protein
LGPANLTGTFLVVRAATIVNGGPGVGLLPTGGRQHRLCRIEGRVIAMSKATVALAPASRVSVICPGIASRRQFCS